MIAEIQVLPTPTGTAEHCWTHIEAAIAVVAQSGLEYEVGPLGKSIEGDRDTLWTTLRRAHEATISAGATSVVTLIKLFDAPGPTPTMAELTEPHRITAD